MPCTDKPLVDRVQRAEVTEDYLPTASDELGLVKGQTVEVVKKMSYGWWKGRTGNAVGIFPSQNVKLVEHHEQQEEVEQETGHGMIDLPYIQCRKFESKSSIKAFQLYIFTHILL